jgi:hypothetical protein
MPQTDNSSSGYSATDLRIRDRCEDLERAFDMFTRRLDNYVSHYYEFQTTQVRCEGLKLSEPLLVDAVSHYFFDIDKYKERHRFSDGNLANWCKVGAFTTYWLATKRPIIDMHCEAYAPMVNDDFALYVGLTMANIDPLSLRMIRDGRVDGQLKSLLSSHTATPDALVPLFELLSSNSGEIDSKPCPSEFAH